LAVKVGVVKLAPVIIRFPLTAASYQSYVPPEPVAVRAAVFPTQILAAVTVGAAGSGVTVTTTAVLILVQPFTKVST